MKRITTGLTGLDRLLGSGFPEKTCVLLSGDAGTGKTLVGLNFLVDGASKGEKCVYITLNEGKDNLLRACDSIKSLSKTRKYLGKTLVIEEVQIKDMVDLEFFTKIFASYPDVDRIVIDNVNKLLIFAESKREYRANLSELIKHLQSKASASLLICETLDHALDTKNGEAYECDGVVYLSFMGVEEKPMRALSIYKMRYTGFDPRVHHRLDITSKGIKFGKTKVI
ncbi:MAG: DUF2075 domain-containing protein [Candidatus Diapherotrites archaeon]|nr:DUF2075 domain-containing protein [Candidatus Diapherotrites archaeon]